MTAPSEEPLRPAGGQGPRDWRRWAFLAGGLALAVLLLVARLSPGRTAQTEKPVRVGTPVISDRLDPKSKRPLQSLENVPGDVETIYAASEVTLQKGATVTVKWYIEDVHMPTADFTLTLQDDYEGWVPASITLGGKPWPPAAYRVEFWLNGEQRASRVFHVTR